MCCYILMLVQARFGYVESAVTHRRQIGSIKPGAWADIGRVISQVESIVRSDK